MRPRSPFLPLLVAAALLAGCQWIPGAKAHTIREAERAVAYQLTDSGSAQFRDERVTAFAGAHPIVCGEVNGKNRLGAYAGFTPFAYEPEARKVFILPLQSGTVASDMETLDFPAACRAKPS